MPVLSAFGAGSARAFGFAARSTPSGPTVIGQSFGGGYYAGKITDNGVQYYLIVAPKATGETTSIAWKTTNTSTSGTSSDIDGPTNSANMNTSNHPAAYFCKGLSIGGYTDWYMPAKNELEVMYYFLKPNTTSNDTSSGSNPNAVSPEPSNTNYTSGSPGQTSATDFQTGGSQSFRTADVYWSSTQSSAFYAKTQLFTTGAQSSDTKTAGNYVRAVRRIPV